MDKRCDPDQIAKDTGLTYNGLRRFLADTVSLFDRIAAINGERGVNDFGLSDEFPRLLKQLRREDEETELGGGGNAHEPNFHPPIAPATSRATP